MTDGPDQLSSTPGYSEFQNAMEDSRVVNAAAEARNLAAFLNLAYPDAYAENSNQVKDENTEKLNAMVAHVIGTRLTLTGRVQFTVYGDESEFVHVDEASAYFQGFVISRRNQSIQYDMSFRVIVKEDSTIMTFDEVNGAVAENIRAYQAEVQAQANELFMDFEKILPSRAMSILSTEDPALLNVLDSFLIGSEDRTDEDTLLALKEFTVNVPSSLSDSEAQRFKISIREYAKGFIDIDTEVPYSVFIDGTCILINDSGNRDVVHDLKENCLFSVQSLEIFTQSQASSPDQRSRSVECFFALHGMILGADLETRGKRAVVPLYSLRELSSMRGIYEEMLRASEN